MAVAQRMLNDIGIPAATLPLAGTESIAVVQNGALVKATAANLSASAANVPWTSVLSFAGVDPTGATDSTTGLQLAITTVGLAGGVLYFPPGLYVADTLNLPTGTANFTMRGAGRGCTTIYNLYLLANGNSKVLLTNQAATDVVTNLVFQDIYFKNNPAGVWNHDQTGLGIIYFSDGRATFNNVRFHRCKFDTPANVSVALGVTMNDLWITHCIFGTNGEHDVYLAGTGSRATLKGNRHLIPNPVTNGGHVTDHCVACRNYSDTVICDNYMENHGHSGVTVRDSGSKRVQITRNLLHNFVQPGANGFGLNIGENIDVCHNLVDGVREPALLSGWGLAYRPSGAADNGSGVFEKYLTVYGNAFSNCVYAINLDCTTYRAPGCAFTRNHCSDNLGGMQVQNTAAGAEFVGNFLYTTAPPPANAYYVFQVYNTLDATSSLRVVDNRAVGYGGNGLYETLLPNIVSAPRGGVRRLSMGGDLVLTTDDATRQHLDPNGANRGVTLPGLAGQSAALVLQLDTRFTFYHFGAANTIAVKSANGGAVVTLAAGQKADVVWDGVAWNAF